MYYCGTGFSLIQGGDLNGCPLHFEDFYLSSFVVGRLNLFLLDDDFTPGRRVIKEDASLNECVRKVLVEKVSFIAFSCAKTRNADKTATLVRRLSLILFHGFIPNTLFTDGSGCHTISFIRLRPASIALLDVSFLLEFIFGHFKGLRRVCPVSRGRDPGNNKNATKTFQPFPGCSRIARRK